MGFTKRQLVLEALDELGIADYDMDILPEQLDSGITKLDAMMMNWNAKGITLFYPVSSPGEKPDPNMDTGLPDIAWEAVRTNLACRLAPSYGKNVSPDTRIAAKQSYDTMLQFFAMPSERQYNIMPKGAGHKSVECRWTEEPVQEAILPVDESIDISGGPV